MNSEPFTIWVESQEYADAHVEEDFVNVLVTFSSGFSIGLNVWSYQFFVNHINALQGSELEEDYLMPPDLVLKDLSESTIRRVVSSLITEEKWLEGRGLSREAPDH
jgi:hypothetical protein